MTEIPNLILIGGTKRHVGKTTLAIHLINKYKDRYPIIGLKVTSVYPNDDKYHGKHETVLESEYEIIEEKDLSGRKDTSKMLLAGASQVFYIRSKDHFTHNAFETFRKQIPENALIICESISLRKYVKPGLFILIKYSLPHQIKLSAQEMEPLADHIIHSDGTKFDDDVERIVFEDNRWQIHG